jgi:hypothetical protein
MFKICTWCKFQCTSANKSSAVGAIGFIIILTTYHSDFWEKLSYEGGIFVLGSQNIQEWRVPEQILIQIWRIWIARMNVVNECERWRIWFWSRITKPILQRRCGCRDKWESLCSYTAWEQETRLKNRDTRFARRNVLGLCISLRVLNKLEYIDDCSEALGSTMDVYIITNNEKHKIQSFVLSTN